MSFVGSGKNNHQITEDNKSEVARLRYQIEQEYRAAELALHGCAAGVSKHAFITAKMERMGECQQQLAKLVSGQQAMNIYIEVTEGRETTTEKGKQP
ncbi:MAG TPA: hypothetical protein VNE61_08065 [Ktedonobacteraceae bacterium]|nr:hypothetical protein [Ktedonobacteraceae bacterium]